MDFKATVATLKKKFKAMFPFGIIGFCVGMAIAFLFMAFQEVIIFLLLIANFITCIQTYKKVTKKIIKPVKSILPWQARKPCPECGNLTTHKKDCSMRKKKP